MTIGRPANPNLPPKAHGIYRFVNWINGKMYVGSAINLYRRRIDHIKDLRANKHKNDYFQKAWNKYGEVNFIFEILELCEKEVLIECEQKWINKFNCSDEKFGYNLNSIAGSNLNRKFNEDFRLKAAARQTGKIPSVETRKRMSEARSGKKRDPNIGLKISAAKKGKGVGRKHSLEQIAKIKSSGAKTRQAKTDSLWKTLLLKAPVNA